jgi:hypothetical protein
MTGDFVWLFAKRNRGWPWPEGSGDFPYLSAMFGESGWCRSCGWEFGDQIGPIRLQRSGLTVTGAWEPYWLPGYVCVDAALADEVGRRFSAELKEVGWPKPGGMAAYQIVVPTVGENWFPADSLAAAIVKSHPRDDPSPGQNCAHCGRWRWYPCAFDDLPPIAAQPAWSSHVAVASPEVFGAGWNAYREVLYRRDLAELIVTASPRDFEVCEVRWAD